MIAAKVIFLQKGSRHHLKPRLDRPSPEGQSFTRARVAQG